MAKKSNPKKTVRKTVHRKGGKSKPKRRVVKPRSSKGSGKKPVKKKPIKKTAPKKIVKKPAASVKRKQASPPKTKKKVVKPQRPKKLVKKPVKKAIKAKPKKIKKPVKKKTVRKVIKPLKKVKSKKVVSKKPVKKKAVKKPRPKPRPRPKVKPRKVVKPKPKPKKKIAEPRSRKRILRKKPVKKKTVRKVKPKPKKAVRKIVRRRKPKKPSRPRIYIGKGTLDQLFESQAKVKLLRLFFRNAEDMFQAKDVFKILRTNAAVLRQEMKKLEKLGLINQKKAWLTFERKKGGIKKEKKTVWFINHSFDFFNELRGLVLKTAVASKDDLAATARKIGNIKLLVLTGVFTGDETARADLLIVGDKINQRKLGNFIKDVEAEVGGEVRCAVMTTKEFNYRYDMYDRFVRDLISAKSEILVKKIDLW